MCYSHLSLFFHSLIECNNIWSIEYLNCHGSKETTILSTARESKARNVYIDMYVCISCALSEEIAMADEKVMMGREPLIEHEKTKSIKQILLKSIAGVLLVGFACYLFLDSFTSLTPETEISTIFGFSSYFLSHWYFI